MVAGIPLDRLMLETDAPYCDVRPTHAGHRCISHAGLPAKSGLGL